jgi:hypothetical protein
VGMYGMLAQVTPDELTAMQADPDHVPSKGSAPGPCSLEKMWHAIHFLITGQEWEGDPPLSLAVFGREEIGEDGGYGPARYLTPEEVRTVSAALATITTEELRRRFDPEAFEAAEIYPGVWDEDPDELFEEIESYFSGLVAYYRDAASRGNAMLCAIT